MKRQSAKLTQNSEPVIWIGVNFWSRAGGPRMWRDYDRQIVGEELRAMRDHGMTVTRSFFYWPDFMPTPDALDEVAVERYRDFLDQHHELGMSTIPTFIVGHMSGQNWDPVWRDGRELYSDVWFVAKQAWYIRELTARFAAHPAIAGWLLSNEIPIYGDPVNRGIGANDSDAVASWSQILIDAVRLGGGTQPVSIGDGAWGIETTGKDNGFRVRQLAPLVDFHGPHVYKMENDNVRQHLAAAFVCELLDIGGKPVILEEFGLSSDYVSEENAGHYYRQVLHNTLLAGATGWLAWNNTDYDNLAEVDPYRHHPFEMHFGVTDVTGKPKAQALEMKAFAELTRRVDVPRLSRPDADVVLVLSSFLEAEYSFTSPLDATDVVDVARQAYIAAREADIAIGIARELDPLPDDAVLYLVPSTKQLTAPTWQFLRERAEAGAMVYASYFVGDHLPQRGLWWPNLDETFGVVKQTRYGLVDLVDDESVTLRFVADFGSLTAGSTLTFPVGGSTGGRSYLPVVAKDAEVLAVDGHGRPALLRKRVGTGSLVLGTYPLEYFASATPEVNPEPTWQLYDALATEAGALRPVRVADGRVLTGHMQHEDGRRFVWFVSESPDHVEVTPDVTDGKLVDLDGNPTSTVALDPFGVAVLQLTR
jgi:endo-1,4-beta-mannosidase